MTEERLRELFDKDNGRGKTRQDALTKRPDLHAFLLLDRLVPGDQDMVASTGHDEIFLDITLEELVKSEITEKDVADLMSCGVFLNTEYDSLSMFV